MEGVKVLEVATWGVAPLAATVLGDWGADVVKIEDRVGGDPVRGVFSDRLTEVNAFDAPWQHVNRGKRSVAVDLAKPAGQAVVHRLAEASDVFVTNFPRSRLVRFAVDVPDIRRCNPSIVYARASSFGPRGADAEKGGHDINAYWSRAGAAYAAQRVADSEYPPGPPAGAFGDYPTALTLAGGIAAALFQRERHGEPSTVDASLFGVGIWSMAYNLIGETEWQRPEQGGRSFVPNPLVNIYRTRDGRFIQLSMVQADRWWADLCTKIDRPDLLADERFRDFHSRRENRAALIQILDEEFSARTYAEWCVVLERVDGPWAPVAAPSEVHDDPQAIANDYFTEIIGADGRANVTVVSVPVQFDERSPALARAPEHGEHTEAVLLESGLTWDEIAELKRGDAII